MWVRKSNLSRIFSTPKTVSISRKVSTTPYSIYKANNYVSFRSIHNHKFQTLNFIQYRGLSTEKKPEPEPQPEPQLESKPQLESQPESKPQSQSQPETQPGSQPQTETQSKSQPETQPGSQPPPPPPASKPQPESQPPPEPFVQFVVESKEEDINQVPDVLTRTEFVNKIAGLLILIGVAIGLTLDLIGNSNAEEREKALEESDEIIEGLQFLRLFPWKLMATIMSMIAQKKSHPEVMKERIEKYMKLYQVEEGGWEKENLTDYKNFEEFFTRRYSEDSLKRAFGFCGLIPEGEAIFSPVQGTVMSLRKISTEKHKEYIKEEWYSAKQFLGFNPFEEAQKIQEERVKLIEDTLGSKVTQIPKKDMYMCVIYLAPGDYHRFHAPTHFTAHKRIYYSGNYYPVRPSYFNFFNYKSLLGTNERVVLSGEGRNGFFAFVPVGATNVGSIHLTSEPDFDNTSLYTDREVVEYTNPVYFRTGDEIGHFTMGSTIVMVFEFADGSVNVSEGQRVALGHPLVVKYSDYAIADPTK